MPREFSRARRVADLLQRELADLVIREVSDPRLHNITISEVEVTSDLAHARVYVTLQSDADVDKTLVVLRRAAGFLRHGLAQRLQLRTLPRLDFIYDATLDKAERLSTLIDTATAVERKDAGGCTPDEPEGKDN